MMKVSLVKPGFAFSEVVAILVDMFNVTETKRDTFVGRLQQLQKAGIPAGANLGRGTKVRYVNWQLADLVLALDLLDLGLTPATLVNHPAASIYARGGYGVHAQESLRDDRADLFYLVRANALAYLSSQSAEATAPNPLDTLQMGRTADSAIEALSEGPAIVFNMTARLRALRTSVEKIYPQMLEQMTFYPTLSGQKED